MSFLISAGATIGFRETFYSIDEETTVNVRVCIESRPSYAERAVQVQVSSVDETATGENPFCSFIPADLSSASNLYNIYEISDIFQYFGCNFSILAKIVTTSKGCVTTSKGTHGIIF